MHHTKVQPQTYNGGIGIETFHCLLCLLFLAPEYQGLYLEYKKKRNETNQPIINKPLCMFTSD